MLVGFAAWSDQIAQYLETLIGIDATYAVALLSIIWINIILSGDNAIVIALACRSLPRRQRIVGIILGAGAAVVLRIVFTVLVKEMFGLPWLKLVGGLILLWIAVKLLLGEEADEDSVKSGANVWEAVKIVAIADIVMSLDNVLAIAGAAGGDNSLIIIGLLISIPLCVFGAGVLAWVLDKVPLLVWAGAALLGGVAGQLLATEPILQPYLAVVAEWMGTAIKVFAWTVETSKIITWTIEALCAVLVVAVGWLILKVSHTRRSAQQAAE